MSYNKIILMGNLVRDPETKQISQSQSLCKFTLAVNRKLKSSYAKAIASAMTAGQERSEVQEQVMFIDVTVWGAKGEACAKYLSKGKSVLVEGYLKEDQWQDKEGNKRSKHVVIAEEVQFLSQSSPQTQQQQEEPYYAQGASKGEQELPLPKHSLFKQVPPLRSETLNTQPPPTPLDELRRTGQQKTFFEDDLPF